MCVRMVRYCCQCDTVFPIPKGQSMARRVECFGGCLTLARGDTRQPIVDLICSNRHCQRQSEQGYLVFLKTRDPCHFCLWFGKESHCKNQVLSWTCDACYAKGSPLVGYSPPTFPYYRTVKSMKEESERMGISGPPILTGCSLYEINERLARIAMGKEEEDKGEASFDVPD